MKVQSFEDLHVFQQARKLANDVFTLSKTGSLAKDYALADQMRRSALSVMSNIAEGFERESTAELIRFLYIAKGSCGELRAQLSLAFDQRHLSKQQHGGLVGQAKQVSAGLFSLIRSLKRRLSS